MPAPVRLYLAAVMVEYLDENDESSGVHLKLLDGPCAGELPHWTGWLEPNKQAARRRIEKDLMTRRLRDEIDHIPGLLWVFPEGALESMSLHHLIEKEPTHV